MQRDKLAATSAEPEPQAFAALPGYTAKIRFLTADKKNEMGVGRQVPAPILFLRPLHGA